MREEEARVGIRFEIELPDELREMLGINNDTVVESYVDGGRLIIQTVSKDEAKQAGF